MAQRWLVRQGWALAVGLSLTSLAVALHLRTGITRRVEWDGLDFYIRHFDVNNQKPQPVLRIILKYDEKRTPAMQGLKRVSKPGRRIYADRHNIPRVQSGMGIAVLTTSKGVVTDREARRLGVGGEVLCHIW